MGLMQKLFGTHSSRQLKKMQPMLQAIETLAPIYSKMSDEGLRETTDILKKRLADGETLDDILPDAFALVRETAERVLGKRPFFVQLMGGILLHQGSIAEMKTGEGKTLVATMPAYLNALTGKGVHIVTVNEYLARLGYEEMGRIYQFLGLTVGLICHGMSKEDKQAAYRADITYGTNNEFGFDYLRDNMVVYKEMLCQRGHAFAIVDEVDSILIDEARTPLIISGDGEASTNLYDRTEALVCRLRQHRIKEMDTKQLNDNIDADYIVDEKAKTAVLTAEGIRKVEVFFGIENLSDPANSTIAHHVYQALKAHGIMHLDEDYVVSDEGKVLIVDSFTGRIMPGRRYSDGLHQAIEAKEHVTIEKENKTLATITFQNYFRLYEKLAGMTGTALTEETEFREIYGLDVVEVPTNRPMIRTDENDLVFPTKQGKFEAIIAQIKACHEKGQPVLVGTVSIEKSEELSKKLKINGIPHTVLNAKYHEKEAEIVAQAGRLGTVTIATNMAGRGTDIMLGGNAEFMAKQEMRKRGYTEEQIGSAVSFAPTDDADILASREVYQKLYEEFKEKIRPEAELVCQAGGLYIIGTERHESRRIDNQLRGRAGRQGDPGVSQFFLSLEDDLLRLFGSGRMTALVSRLGLPYNQPISARLLSNSIEMAQKRLEANNFERRKYVLSYDDVMNQQREVIYRERGQVLDGADLQQKIWHMTETVIRDAVSQIAVGESVAEWNFDELRTYFASTLCTKDDFTDVESLPADEDALVALLTERAKALYEEKERLLSAPVMREAERRLLLRNVDLKWMDHLEDMDALKGAIGLQAYAQRNPINEYRLQGADLFDAMIAAIREDTVRALFSLQPAQSEERRAEVAKVTNEGFEGGQKPKKRPVRRVQKIGPNDPCPCGSGKKYKKCCGAGS